MSRSSPPFRIPCRQEDVMRQARFSVLLVLVLGHVAASTARAEICLAIDEKHDMLAPADRSAAVLLLSKQFELVGEHVAAPDCAARYTLSHIRLGHTIVVTLDGPGGHREGTALGLDDLPALYNQMARSIVTGRPMEGFNVVDRTNVTAAQATPERVTADSLWYARLGYGSVFGDSAYGGPVMGLGYRVELDRIGIDVSFFNFQSSTAGPYSTYGSSDGAFAGSMLKLEG